MRRLKAGALSIAVALPVLFTLLGGALTGGAIGSWYAGLVKPWFLVPLWAFYIVGFVYYVGVSSIRNCGTRRRTERSGSSLFRSCGRGRSRRGISATIS